LSETRKLAAILVSELVMGAEVTSAKHRCNRDGSQKSPYSLNPFTLGNVGMSFHNVTKACAGLAVLEHERAKS
jgi:hypothetical protein